MLEGHGFCVQLLPHLLAQSCCQCEGSWVLAGPITHPLSSQCVFTSAASTSQGHLFAGNLYFAAQPALGRALTDISESQVQPRGKQTFKSSGYKLSWLLRWLGLRCKISAEWSWAIYLCGTQWIGTVAAAILHNLYLKVRCKVCNQRDHRE